MSTYVRHLLGPEPHVIHSISPDNTVYEAISLMATHEIGALLVMSGGQLVGILSERDYTRKVILMDRSSKTTKVSEIMSRNVIHVTPDADINECLNLMSVNNIRHLPVMSEGRVVGVISIMNVIRSIITDKEFIIEQLENYIAG
jgi:CBS domain-containing protein